MRKKPNMGMGGGGGKDNRHRPRKFVRPNGGNQGSDENGMPRMPRKNASAARDKYLSLARDALSAGDRILAENYHQHADHYYRILAAMPPEEPQHRPRHESHHSEPREGNGNVDVSEQGEPSEALPPAHVIESAEQESYAAPHED